MELEFIKYPHIKNIHPLDPELPTDSRELAYDGEYIGEYIASEKIDGANFQFVVTAKEMVYCSRNMILEPDRVFHNFQDLTEKYNESVKAVFRWCCQKEKCSEDELVVRIYGEIFGGFYPDINWDWKGPSNPIIRTDSNEGATGTCNPKDISCDSDIIHGDDSMDACGKIKDGNISLAKVNKVRVKPSATGPVQTRIHYIPDIDYYLFDITYTRLNTDDVAHPHYLNVDELLEVASQCGFTYVARPLHSGSLSELCKLPREYPTTIPAQAGLPNLQPGDLGELGNIAEGYVIRPRHLRNRTMPYRLKLKSEKFLEFTSPGCTTTAPKARPVRIRKRLRKVVLLSEKQQEMQVHLLSGINANRLAGVVSKQERTELRNMHERRIASLLIDDALDEIMTDRDDLSELFDNVDKMTIRLVKESVTDDAVDLVREAKPGF